MSEMKDGADGMLKGVDGLLNVFRQTVFQQHQKMHNFMPDKNVEMGLYNILIAEVTCQYCSVKYDASIQFKYGKMWLIKYILGDTIQWDTSRWNGKYSAAGNPDLKKVKVHGLNELDKCPLCKRKAVEEFDISIEHNIIAGLSPMETYQCYLDADTGDDGDYVVLEV